MHVGRFVFNQLIDHLPPHEFLKCVVRYKGNYRSCEAGETVFKISTALIAGPRSTPRETP